jgi:hypothetical protein
VYQQETVRPRCGADEYFRCVGKQSQQSPVMSVSHRRIPHGEENLLTLCLVISACLDHERARAKAAPEIWKTPGEEKYAGRDEGMYHDSIRWYVSTRPRTDSRLPDSARSESTLILATTTCTKRVSSQSNRPVRPFQRQNGQYDLAQDLIVYT